MYKNSVKQNLFQAAQRHWSENVQMKLLQIYLIPIMVWQP